MPASRSRFLVEKSSPGDQGQACKGGDYELGGSSFFFMLAFSRLSSQTANWSNQIEDIGISCQTPDGNFAIRSISQAGRDNGLFSYSCSWVHLGPRPEKKNRGAPRHCELPKSCRLGYV